MKIYLTASYEENVLHYAGILEKNNGVRSCLNGKLAGSMPETSVSAIGVALKQAKESGEPICVYTDLEDAVKWAKGERKPIAKRIKDFVKYVKKTEEELGLTFESYIPDELKPELERVASSYKTETKSETNPFAKKKQFSSNVSWGSGWRKAVEDTKEPEEKKEQQPSYAIPKPYAGAKQGGFRVIVHNAKGELLCDLDQDDFGRKNLADAVFFADWYEQESKTPDSYFYGVKVEKYNVPPKKEPARTRGVSKTEVKQTTSEAKLSAVGRLCVTKPEHEKTSKAEEQFEQLNLF